MRKGVFSGTIVTFIQQIVYAHQAPLTVRRYVILMGATTLLSWAVWALILFTIDPTISGLIGHSAFFVTLLFALAGTFSLAGLLIRRLANRDALLFRQIGTSFRQGLFFSLFFTGSLALQAGGFLKWWNLLVYLLLLACLEFFFLAREQKPR